MNRSFHVRTLKGIVFDDVPDEVVIPEGSVCLAQEMTDHERGRFPEGSVWVFYDGLSLWLEPKQFERFGA